MFTAYFDESGTHDSSAAVVVSGYVASNQQWTEFDREWKKALDDEGLSHFHMKDFAHSKKEFSDWKGDETRRKQFLERLISIIRKNTRKSFSYAVILKAYRELNSKYCLEETIGKPYAFCSVLCLMGLEVWKQEHGYRDPVQTIFEDGAADKKDFKQLLNKDSEVFPIFGQKREYTPLQAADLVAWEHLKIYTTAENGTMNTRRLRKPFLALNSMPQEWAVYKIENLRDICRRQNIPLRASQPNESHP
jgi:hypothetical protein